MWKRYAVAAVFGLVAAPALGGPSENSLFRPGDAALHRREVVVGDRAARPYALTGERSAERRVLVWRDVAGGNGQAQHRTPFWVTVSE